MAKEVVFNLGYSKLAGKQWLSSNPSALRVLSLHGWLDNAASFDSLAPYLSDFNHVALDQSGHGLSDHKPDGSFYHLWDHALDAIRVLQNSTQSSWVIGHSMGGAVAMLVAALAPEKVRGLIILDNMGPLSANPQERVVTMQRAMQKMLKYRGDRQVRYPQLADLVHARMQGMTKLSEAAATPLVRRAALETEHGWHWRHDPKLTFPSPFRMDEAAVEAFISEIKCPTLALVAEEGIYQDNLTLVKKRSEAFPWIKLEWLPGGHHFHLEPSTATLVAQQITKFIDQN
jgi:pimeloyl-ACP methyl ester carboxylesterase